VSAAASATPPSYLDAARRQLDLAAVASGEVADVLVVGGGVTGAGVALDAASRGLSVTVVERHDLAAGTSRWSSKLAHGGLRYIAAGQVAVAWESAVERNRLATTIAPHLVRPMPFLMPAMPWSPRLSRPGYRALLAVADGLRAAAGTPTWLPRTRWADAQETHALLPALGGHAGGSYVHVDGTLEDDARLVVSLARTAAAHGARIVTHCAAVEVSRDGARLRDELTGVEVDARARCVVVAAGVWCGGLVDRVPLRPSKGAHLVVRAAALGRPQAAFNVMLPGSLNRFVFAAPRPDGTVLVGLTDDEVDHVVDEPQVTPQDEEFLLTTLSRGLSRPLTGEDVIGRYAGLRPLLGVDGGPDAAAGVDGSTSADLSRRHALLDREGVLVIVGGKLTTYRRMAQDATDQVVRRLGRDSACRTAALPLVGAPSAGAGLGPAGELPSRLRRRFGTEAEAVGASGPVEAISRDVPALRCEAAWALAAEGAVTADDVLDRRLRLDLVPAWRAAARPYVEELIDPSARSAHP
jgi:glycerol-3-phosphate dehydrogenase